MTIIHETRQKLLAHGMIGFTTASQWRIDRMPQP